MDSKLIAVEITKDHPKLMRLPSVSRCLHFSIMPKSCYDMYEKPTILKLQQKLSQPSQPPLLSKYRNKRTKRVHSYEARPMIKPCPNSYIYNKMFNQKPQPDPPKFAKKHDSRPQTTPVNPMITFYCEINPPKSAPKRTARFKSLNNTLIELGEMVNMRSSPTRNSLNKNEMVDKEMLINISGDEDLDKISEVHSSMELSIDSQELQNSKRRSMRKG